MKKIKSKDVQVAILFIIGLLLWTTAFTIVNFYSFCICVAFAHATLIYVLYLIRQKNDKRENN